MTQDSFDRPSAGSTGDYPREVRAALARAQQLSDSRPHASDSNGWYSESLHVGDFSVLALALRR